MNVASPRFFRILCFAVAVVIVGPFARGQNKEAIVEGKVYDAQSVPLEGVRVLLESVDRQRKFTAHSDVQGKFRFETVPEGNYNLHASLAGFTAITEAPFIIREAELKTVDLHLQKNSSNPGAAKTSSEVDFSEESQFQIAGIADPTNYGGHGSDTVMRTKEALAKETVALNRDEPAPVSRADSPNASEVAADLHRRKGDSAESEGRPLDAVREYQLAAELQQNEPNIFAWGAELLLHRAFEPAIEVFSKGHHLFPHSVRILLGLGIATYDQGDTERGQQFILAACDLNPSDPMPYLFLGKLQEAEGMESPIGTEKYRRLVSLHPENAMAHYYYAVALSKQSSLSENKTVVEVELKKAIELDSALGKAYLQLGIVYCAKKDFPSAIQAFQAAIRTMPSPDEAHYRLAQIYNQTGEIEKAHNEIALFNQSSQERIRTAEVQRHEIQRFVYTLRTPNSSPRSTNDKPK